jgi:peptidoglycan/LPS O-acetylase OafA/YrhL
MPEQRSYIPQIDSLRAFAVLAVVAFHLNGALLPGGFVGVDVFFVISGYVVSSTLMRNSSLSFGRFALQFYSRRIMRILPALLVCMIVTTIFTAAFIPSSWLSQSNYVTLLLALLGLSNFSLMFVGDNYFAPRVDFNPATHTWSLGVEEQFYLIFPLIYFVWLKSKHSERPGIIGKWLLALLIALSFCYSAYASLKSPVFAYYSLPSRFWELGLGGLLFQIHSGRHFISSTPARADACLLASGILLCVAFEFSQADLFPVPWGLAATFGSLLCIDAVVASQGRDSLAMRALAWRPLVGVGKISYSLYLWHWPVYVLFRWTVGLETLAAEVAALLIIFLLAIASYRYVEGPTRHNSALLRRPAGFIVGTGIAAAVCSVLVVLTLMKEHTYLSLSVTNATRDWYPGYWPLDDGAQRGCRIVLSPHALSGGSVTEFTRTGDACANNSPSKDLYVIGDSHATALITLFSKLAAADGARVHMYAKSGCAFLRIRSVTDSPACAAFGEAFTRELREKAKPGDIVFLPSLRMARIGNQWGGAETGATSSGDQFSRGMQEAEQWLTSIEGLDLRVVFLAPTPVFGSPPFRCADWFNRHNPVCNDGLQVDRETTLQRRKPVLDRMQELAKRYPNVEIWDPFDRLCAGERCSAFHEGHPLFFDGHHLSGYGNLFIYDSFRKSVV